ncbi:MAG: dihydrodipicolinate synthase family protein [Chloroflexota bacterium]|nr:dihydrodipicolinate synthase family protein [Chloroflexota bacterium]
MKRLDGVNILLMTPYTESNEIDVQGIFRQIDRVLEAGATSVVVQGKIGEYDTYSMDERRDTARAVVEYVSGAAPVGVGIINATFDDGLAVGRIAAESGADYVMSRPPIDGDSHDYFLRLADIVPVMLYDQGLRGEFSIRDDILPITQQTENIIALKISGIPDKNYEAKQLLDIPVLCGWDLMSLLAYQMGSDGVISGSATLVPEHEVRLYDLVKQGRWDEARDLYYGKLVPILNYCTFDPHAYSVCKYILRYMGVIENSDVRPPNPDAGEARAAEVYEVLKRVGVLEPEGASLGR